MAQKGVVGDKVLHLNLKGQPHVHLDFCELKKNHHQGGTHTGMEEGVGPPPRADCERSWVNMEGAHTDIGEGVGPPLRVGCDQSWASLGLAITYMYISGVQNVESMGQKCDERSTSSPFPMLIEKYTTNFREEVRELTK